METKTDPDIIPDKNISHDDPSRPFLLSLICLFAFIFFGIFSLLCLLALVKSGWIADVKDQYLPSGTSSKVMTYFIFTSGSILHLTALIGVIQIWRKKRHGYLIFSVCALILASYQLFSSQISLLTTLVYIGLIILFALFYHRLK